MNVGRIPYVLTAALAVLAAPAPAFACDHEGGGAGASAQHAKPMKPGAKPGTPPKPAAGGPAKPAAPSDCCTPAKPAAGGPVKTAAPSDCCTPPAAAAEAPKGMAACCAKTAAGNPQACCLKHMKGDKQACCEAGAKPDAKEACCDTPGQGDCCSADKPHGMAMDNRMGHHGMSGKPGMRIERRIEMRRGHGGWGRHFPGADRYMGPEVRFMPAMGASTNQYLVLAQDRRMQVNDWVSLGGQTDLAIQLGSAPNSGPWVVPYMGFVPRLGTSLGPVRADVGALLGVGGMMRTGTVATTNDVLQARLMWVVEPRVEIGWRGERMGVGLVGAYNLNPNMSDFGGVSAGLKMTWKHPAM